MLRPAAEARFVWRSSKLRVLGVNVDISAKHTMRLRACGLVLDGVSAAAIVTMHHGLAPIAGLREKGIERLRVGQAIDEGSCLAEGGVHTASRREETRLCWALPRHIHHLLQMFSHVAAPFHAVLGLCSVGRILRIASEARVQLQLDGIDFGLREKDRSGHRAEREIRETTHPRLIFVRALHASARHEHPIQRVEHLEAVLPEGDVGVLPRTVIGRGVVPIVTCDWGTHHAHGRKAVRDLVQMRRRRDAAGGLARPHQCRRRGQTPALRQVVQHRIDDTGAREARPTPLRLIRRIHLAQMQVAGAIHDAHVVPAVHRRILLRIRGSELGQQLCQVIVLRRAEDRGTSLGALCIRGAFAAALQGDDPLVLAGLVTCLFEIEGTWGAVQASSVGVMLEVQLPQLGFVGGTCDWCFGSTAAAAAPQRNGQDAEQ
mmetsp:Transcript_92405/g.298662  ORF Transcript_92405/g.298662 Transcript_92405/m.298662 type:complete len:431 (+) Transcript_92405:95-1387(+)